MIWIPIVVLAVIAIVLAVMLTLSTHFFGVKEDERYSQLRDCLPGANCGSCGYSGCDGYAKALSEGETDKCSLCTPGGDGVAKQLAEIMGTEVEDVVELVAYVACNGSCHPDEKKYVYDGIKTCKAANANYAGDRLCTYACLGYGDCASVCPRNAISINDHGVAEIDPQKCIGCGLCEKTCPNNIIHLVKDTERVIVKCNNHDKGAETRKVCNNGCISCGKCEKTCPHGAIKVVNNLATIDYGKCTGCGMCKEVCPVKCIHAANLKCGAHFE